MYTSTIMIWYSFKKKLFMNGSFFIYSPCMWYCAVVVWYRGTVFDATHVGNILIISVRKDLIIKQNHKRWYSRFEKNETKYNDSFICVLSYMTVMYLLSKSSVMQEQYNIT